MRLSLLSNVTVSVLASMLSAEHTIWQASGYGAWMETALQVPDDLRTFNPDAVILLLDKHGVGWNEVLIDSAVTALEKALPQTVVWYIDLEDLFLDCGDSVYDERMWALARMPWSLKGMSLIQAEINRLLEFLHKPPYKLLAVDLDNTLWQGVIGEEGVEGIAPNVALQQTLLELKNRGILLVVLSRNNPEDVQSVWQDSRMILHADDFVAIRLGWQEKSSSLLDVVKTLNIGLDSCVFLDDNPAERLRMAVALPAVTIVTWPITPARLKRFYFPRLRITDEDAKRTAQYQAEQAREISAQGLNYETYLAQLKIWYTVHRMTAEEYPRVAQLSQKTNQFNVCTNRYTISDVSKLAEDSTEYWWTVHTGDRFGDLGLVAFVRVRCAGQVAEILDWVMSCRAMNRQLEFSVEKEIEASLYQAGIKELHATWLKTVKNAPVENLFGRFGFEVCESWSMGKKYCKLIRN